MAVLIQKGKPPEGAVKLTDAEAADMQWKLIHSWKPASDVWPFRYGMASLAVGTTISAIMIVGHFRRKLKLQNLGHFAMYLPAVAVPTLSLPAIHSKFVSEPILLQAECPVCIQLRSIFLQNCLGVFYPLILAPISGFMIATANATVRLPDASLKNTGALISTYRSMLKPFSNRILGLSLVNTLLAIAVTEGEARCLFKIQRSLRSELFGITEQIRYEEDNEKNTENLVEKVK